MQIALKEFKRCLKPGGYAIIFVPDLEDVKATQDVILESPSGPISGLDMIYGYSKAMREGNLFMAHKCGFTAETLEQAFDGLAFTIVKAQRLKNYNLMVVAVK